MDTNDDSTREKRYAAAYAAMAAFEDSPRKESHPLSGYPLGEQFRIDLVLWIVERLRRMGRAVDAAWLMYELLSFRADAGALDADMDAFVHHVVLHRLLYRMWLQLPEEGRAQGEVSRIVDTLVEVLESVE